jgi:hypothetical protein
MVIGIFTPRFGILYQEKSGTTELDTGKRVPGIEKR